MDLALERRALKAFEDSLLEAPDAQEAWIAAHCGSDEALLAAVRALADAARQATAFPTELPAAFAAAAAPPPPARVGPYRMVECIGQGGMGDVWRAERDDGLFEQSVAVKRLRPTLFSPAATAYFDTERRVLARLRHRNIAQLYDGGADETGAAYFVMELLSGLPIDAHVTKNALDARAIARLVIDVGAGIQHAHAANVVHADIKPSNIIVDADGVVKLLDFGIAQVMTAPPQAGGDHGAFPLTPAYASPARLAGERPTPSDDIFALGVTLFELLTGAPRQPDARLPLSPNAALTTPVDEDLDFIVARATDPRPDHRYESAGAFAADLENWLYRRPLAARPRDWRYASWLFIRRHPLGVAAAIAALIGLTGALIVTGSLYARAEQRFAELRSLAKYQIFDLYDSLAEMPGTTETRFRMAREAQGYLDKLARGAASPGIRHETAAGYLRLAEVQGVPGGANLGDLESARTNITRAEALLAGDASPEARLERARARIMRAGIAIWGDQRIPDAKPLLADAERLLTPTPAQPSGDWLELQQALLLRQMELADWQEEETRVLALAATADAALARWPSQMRADERWPLAHARNLMKQGDAKWYLNDQVGALAAFEAADITLREALVRMPNKSSLLGALMVNGYNVATTLDSLGRPAAVVPKLRETLAVGDRLLKLETRDQNLRRIVSRNQSALAQILATQGRYGEALAEQTAVVDAHRTQSAAHAQEARAARDLAFQMMILGTIHWRAHHRSDACGLWTESRAGFLALKTRGALTPFDESTQIPFLENNLGVCAGRVPATKILLP